MNVRDTEIIDVAAPSLGVLRDWNNPQQRMGQDEL